MSAGIALIGAGGFVGVRLTETLVLAGLPNVRAIVRGYRNLAGLCRFGSAVDVRRADAENPAQLAEALRGVHTAVNLTTGAPTGIVRSTPAIYEACRAGGVSRLIHLSSAVVYGDVLTPTGDDDPPLTKHWMPYARAKAQSEIWLRERLLHGAIEVVVLRPGIVWGVRSPHTLGFARLLCGKRGFLVDQGQGIFNGIYIDNLTAAIRACCARASGAPGFYNVGDAETITWRQFYDALGAALGCDAARLPEVSGERFPRSVAATVDAVQSLSLVNALYHRLKARLPEGLKSTIKAQLAGAYSYDRVATTYASSAAVDRELWHLQRVRHKLPIDKFAKAFHFAPPISFDAGAIKTIAWLRSMGLGDAALAAPPAAINQAVPNATRR
jgi:nucleoside-diphosphate-sugar epimerase